MKTETQVNGLSLEDILSARGNIDGLLKRMKFAAPLSEEARNEYLALKLGSKKMRLIEKRLLAAQHHRDQFPPSFDLAQFERDGTMALALSGCIESIERMLTAVHDTLLVVGSRALVASKAAYGYLQVGMVASGKLQATVDGLSSRRSRSAAAPVEPEVLPKPAAPVETASVVKAVTDDTSKAA